MNNHADNIIQAVETIVDQKLNSFAFDKTESCKIVSQDSNDKQKYWVSNGNMRFEAYALNGENNYSINSQVYVLIPKGDYNERKIILGSASDQVNVATEYTKPFENIIIANSFELLKENKLSIDNTLKSSNMIINIQDLENNTGFGVYDYIGVEFSIISNIISKADFYVKLQLLNNEGNNISEEDSLIFDSKQICGNPYALNENFTFQHLFYFPKLNQEINTINQIKVELGWKDNDNITLNIEDIVKLNKYDIYFSYDKNNQQLSQQTIMSIQFPNIQNEDIKKTYVSPLSSTASIELQEQYKEISESYKRKTLKFDWYKNNEIINYGPRINNIDSKFSEYDIYWCQYLSKSPYTKLLDNDIEDIRNCYYSIENSNRTEWISNNLTIDNNSFQSLFVKEEAKDKYGNIIGLKQNVDSIIQSNEEIQTVTGLYYLKTKDPDIAPSIPDNDEGITTIEIKPDMWTTVCPENINMDGRFYTCLQKTDISGAITYSNPISYFDNITIKTITISFSVELVSQSNTKENYYNNLTKNDNLKNKFINNNNLLEKYKAIYDEIPEIFEINLTNQFKDIVESGTYWQTIKKANATDPNAYIYDLYLPESGSTREQNEEQVKAIIKNNTTGEWIEVSGFIFQGAKTIEDLVIDEELNQINDNIVKQVEIELGNSNSHVQEPWLLEENAEGSFYWFRQKIINKNDKTIYGPAMCFTNENVNTIVPLYYLQTDGNSAPNQPSSETEIVDLNNISDKWTTKCPEYISKGQFWTCLQYKVEEELIWTKPIQALVTNPPKKTDIEFIGIEENENGGSNTPAWNDSNWNTIYEKPSTEKKVYIWQRTKTIYTNNIIQYGDSINIDNQALKDGKTPITIIDLYYLDENGDMTIEGLKEELNKYPPVGGDLETGINKWTKWQPQIPPPSTNSKYWTALYYIYDNNSSGYGEPVIDERLTSTAAAVDATVVGVNIFFTRTIDNIKPPQQPNPGSKAQDGKIEVNDNGIIITWYDNAENIPLDNNDTVFPYLWQCTQMITNSEDTAYTNPVLIKTKQMINSIELYYLWDGTGNEPTTGSAPSKPNDDGTYNFNTWYDSIPPWKTDAHSYFTCVQITYDTGEITYTTPTQSQGTPVEIDIEFAIDDNDDITNYPDNGWSTNYPSDNKNNKPIWTRQKTKYANGTITYSGHTCINLKDIKNIVELYYLKTQNPSNPPSKPTSAITTTIMSTGEWTLSIPEYVSGGKYYTCIQTEYIDGSHSWSNVTDATDKNSSVEATNKANSAADRADSAANKAEENAQEAAQKAQAAEDAANSVVKDINAYFTVTDSSETIPTKPADGQQPDENGQIIITDGQIKTTWYDEPTNAMLNDYSLYLWQTYKKTTHDGTIIYTNPVLLTIPAVGVEEIHEIYYLQTGEPPILPNPENTIGDSKGPDVWTTQMPSYINNGAYWSCIQCIYTDGTKTYTNLTLISEGIDVETSRIQELYQLIDSEFIDELEVIIDENNPGVYNYYELNCSLEQSKRYATYGIKAKFFDNRETTPIEGKYYKIIWEVPKSATMIKLLSNYENLELITIEDNDDYYEYQGYLEYENNEWKTPKGFSYQLQQLFGYNKINNTIWCKIIEYDADPRINTSSINKVFVGRLKQDLKFGFKNTAGTDWRLNIFSDKSVLLENDEITLTAILQDPEGNTVPQEEWQQNLVWDWYSRDDLYQVFGDEAYEIITDTGIVKEYQVWKSANVYPTITPPMLGDKKWCINEIIINNIDETFSSYTLTIQSIDNQAEQYTISFEGWNEELSLLKVGSIIDFIEDGGETDAFVLTLYMVTIIAETSQIKVTRATSQDYYAILRATLNNITIKDNYKVNLTAYFPVASSNKDSYYLNGPSIIVYDREGTLQNYDSNTLYQIFENGIEFNQEVVINIYEEGQEENFMFKLKDNQLYPCSVLPSNIPKAGVFCAITNNDSFDYYIQPLLIVRDVYYYKRNLINKWDGALQIDEANNAILAASFIAGRKELDNTFTGVLLGEVGADIDQKGINGIYGVQEGLLRYKFTENGEAYIGTGSDNYIDFSNNQLSIKTNDLVLDTSNLDINTKATGTDPVLTVSGRANIGGWSIGSDIFECTRTDENGEGFRVILRTPLTKGGPGYGGIHDILVLTEYTAQTDGTIASTYPFVLTSDGGLVANKATINGLFTSTITTTDAKNNSYTHKLIIGDEYTNTNPIRDEKLLQGITISNTNQTNRTLLLGPYVEYFGDSQQSRGNVLSSQNDALYILSSNTSRIVQSNETTASRVYISSRLFLDDSYPVTDWAPQASISLSTTHTKNVETTTEISITSDELRLDSSNITIDAITVKTYGSWSGSVSSGTNSDKRLKNSIINISEQYSIFFDHLIPVTYKYNDGTSNRLHTGFIAQDVEEALNKASISTQDFAGIILLDKDTENEHWALRYEEFIALNTWQIQKLKTRVIELENEIKEIKQRYEI